MRYSEMKLYERIFTNAIEGNAEDILEDAYEVENYDEVALYNEAIEKIPSEVWADIFTYYLEDKGGYTEEEIDAANAKVYAMEDSEARYYVEEVLSEDVIRYNIYNVADILEEEVEHREEEKYASSHPYESRGLSPDMFF